MKYVKFALCAALSILICLPFAVQRTAWGETSFRYAYAWDETEEGEKAYLCEKKDISTAWFAIPETYCVEILGEEGEWYECRYAKNEGAYKALYGYCLKSNLIPIKEPLENEYLNYTFKVELRADLGGSPIKPLTVPLTVAFYGNGKMNASGLSYVYYDGNYGYVAGQITGYPRNDLPQPTLSTDVTQGGNPLNATLITAAVITVVAVIAVAVLYFAGKRPKLPPKSDT